MNKIIIVDTFNLSTVQFNKIYSLIDDERRRKVEDLLLFKDKKMSIICEICLYYLLSIKYKYSKKIISRITTPLGKPYFKNLKGVYFSFSHSNEMCAVALSTKGEVGIDIEHFSVIDDLLAKKILGKYFTVKDISLVKKQKTAKEKLLYLWTQKEAFYKACGNGLFIPTIKIPFSIDEIEKIKTVKKNKYIFSIYSSCKKNKIIYINNESIDNIINEVAKWKHFIFH